MEQPENKRQTIRVDQPDCTCAHLVYSESDMCGHCSEKIRDINECLRVGIYARFPRHTAAEVITLRDAILLHARNLSREKTMFAYYKKNGESATLVLISKAFVELIGNM